MTSKPKQTTGRIQARNLLLTYSQIPKTVKHGEILEQLKTIVSIKNFIIALESHQDGGLHCHALLFLYTKCDKKLEQFNIMLQNKLCKGNYKPAGTPLNAIPYVIKGGNYITNLDINEKEGRLITMHEKLYARSMQIGILPALVEYQKNHPDAAMKNYGAVRSNLFRMQKDTQKLLKFNSKTVQLENTGILENPYLTKMLLRYLAHFEKTKDKPIKEVPDILAFGESGYGKSCLGNSIALRVSEDNYREFLDIEQVNDALTDQDQAIVLHESNLDAKYPNNSDKAKIHQGSHMAGGRVLYSFLTFRAGLIKIFTIKDLKDHLGLAPDLQTLRRILILPVATALKINWDDPEVKEFIKIPKEVQEEVNKIHYQFDPEIIKFNCWAIATFCPEITLPKEVAQFLPTEHVNKTTHPLDRDIKE